MRSWIVDQYEFDNWGTEENLEINYAKCGDFPFPDVSAFVASAVGVDAASSLGEAVRFDEGFGYGLVRKYLHRFTGLEMPSPCVWPTYVLTEDSNNECHIILCGPDCYIRYSWYTTA
jgi:hypothetical protein